MEQHVLHSALVRLFSGQAARHEVVETTAHLSLCQSCWTLAALVYEELRKDGVPQDFADERSAVVTFLDLEEGQARSRLSARGRWAELKRLPAGRQLERIKADPSLRTPDMFRTILEEAAALAREDPYLAEETALVAHGLAGLFPDDDLQGKALLEVANCRRLAADWQGSMAELRSAQKHFQRGTGDAALEARCLSIRASLASDTGHLEQALILLARASGIYRKERAEAAVASTAIKEAGTLLASCRYEEAIARAEEALGLLAPQEVRLEMLARSIVTEALALSGRPGEALRSLLATWPLYEQIGGGCTDLRLGYLEALVLDALGHARESEKLYRAVIAGYMEAEQYKEAFLTLLTLFEFQFRRGALRRAAETCEEAIERIEQAGMGCHAQILELWRDLLALVDARRLTEHQLLAARHYLARHWNAPARQAPLTVLPERALPKPATVIQQAPPPITAGPPPPGDGGDYRLAMERYDRALIANALIQCGGRIRASAAVLGIATGTLRVKLKKYGLSAEELVPADPRPAAIDLLREDERRAERRLCARGFLAELRLLPASQQADRIGSTLALQSQEMVEALIEEAAAAAPANPRLGEERALIAYNLAGSLPRSRCSEPCRNDLQGGAMAEAGNCRRLAASFQGSAAAFRTAQRHLERGSGDPLRQARLLSVQASLAADTGHAEEALAMLARASEIYLRAQDYTAVASVTVKLAGVLLAACRHEEAAARAGDALRSLPPKQLRLELLARSILTESLASLGRPGEALRSLAAAWPLFEQVGGRETELRRGYLEARVLDGLGHARESEALYRSMIEGCMEAEQYKEAFLTLLTLFESLFRRGELGRAARVCEEAIARIEEADTGLHAPIIEAWRELLALVTARSLTDQQLLEARHALMRIGQEPAHEPPVPQPRSEDRRVLRVMPPAPPTRFAPGDYKKALEHYDRRLIAAALEQCGGRIEATQRVLGISAPTLRERMKKYGLTSRA